MIITCVKGNHLYLSFQDFEDKVEGIYSELHKFPFSTIKHIKKILNKNFFDNTLERQKSYVNSISTYIDSIDNTDKQYFFHLYILPKDINIKFDSALSDLDKIDKIKKLSIKLFKLYSELLNDQKLIHIFKHSEGKDFLQLESDFYIEKLESIYNTLLNYRSHYKKKVICSDKKIGIAIDDLNIKENNPLKNYQFINIPFQKDLIRFVYSTIDFLKKHRLEIFKESNEDAYTSLTISINKINNLLIKISTHKNVRKDELFKDTLKEYFKKYKNNEELKNNYKLFNIVKSIFYTQLESNAYLFISIDLTRVFERIIEEKLKENSSNLYIGKESEKFIMRFSDNVKEITLNCTNHLLNNCYKEIKQYPDFLIKADIDNTTVYHVIDAKYKLKKNIFNANDVRQILIYSILFNKEYSNILPNQKNIKKIIIYADESEINISNYENLKLNFEPINLECSECKYEENVFNSKILFIPIKTIQLSQ